MIRDGWFIAKVSLPDAEDTFVLAFKDGIFRLRKVGWVSTQVDLATLGRDEVITVAVDQAFVGVPDRRMTPEIVDTPAFVPTKRRLRVKKNGN